MNKFSILKLSNKVVKIISKPFKALFGSDERGFVTLLIATIVSYTQGFPDAATIFAVYSAMFGYAGMQVYNDSSSEGSDSKQDLEDMQDMMDDALGMAEEFQEQAEQEVEE
jgi:hypothetical protein